MFQATILGNLTRDAVQRTLADGRQMMSFTVAANGYKEDETVFCDVLTRYSEGVFNYLRKGQQVVLMGRCSIRLESGYLGVHVYPDVVQLCGSRREESAAETPVV